MIEDKKRKTRRVSKKVKKMHEEAVAKGVLGSEKLGGGMMSTYKIDHIKGDGLISSQLQGDIGVEMMSLGRLINKIDSEGGYIRIEKADFGGRSTKIYKLKSV